MFLGPPSKYPYFIFYVYSISYETVYIIQPLCPIVQVWVYEKNDNIQPMYPTARPLFKRWAKVEKPTCKFSRKRKHEHGKVMFSYKKMHLSY